MTVIDIKSSVPLNAFAKENLQKLQFSQSSIVTEPTMSFEKPQLSWFGRRVESINTGHSVLAKIAKITSAIFLTCSLIGIPLLVLYSKEANRQDSVEKAMETAVDKLDKQVAQINMRGVMVEKLGLDEFDKVPQLDLAGRVGNNGDIDFLKPNELSQPIMKGVDKLGRPFIAIRLRDGNDQTHVMTLFQKYSNSDSWTWCSSQDVHDAFDETGGVKEATKDSLRKIIAGEAVNGFKLDADAGMFSGILKGFNALMPKGTEKTAGDETTTTSWTTTALKLGALGLGLGLVGLGIKYYFTPDEIVPDAACVASQFGSCAISLPNACSAFYNQNSDALGALFNKLILPVTSAEVSKVFDTAAFKAIQDACLPLAYGTCAVNNYVSSIDTSEIMPGVCEIAYDYSSKALDTIIPVTSSLANTLYNNSSSIIENPYAIAEYIPSSISTEIVSNVFDAAFSNVSTAVDVIKNACLPLAYGTCAVANYVPSIDTSGVCEIAYDYSSKALDTIIPATSSLANTIYNNSSSAIENPYAFAEYIPTFNSTEIVSNVFDTAFSNVSTAVDVIKNTCVSLAYGPCAVAHYIPITEIQGMIPEAGKVVFNNASTVVDHLSTNLIFPVIDSAATVITNVVQSTGSLEVVSDVGAAVWGNASTTIESVIKNSLEGISPFVSVNPEIGLGEMAFSTMQKVGAIGETCLNVLGTVGGITKTVIDSIVYSPATRLSGLIGAGGILYYRNKITDYFEKGIKEGIELEKAAGFYLQSLGKTQEIKELSSDLQVQEQMEFLIEKLNIFKGTQEDKIQYLEKKTKALLASYFNRKYKFSPLTEIELAEHVEKLLNEKQVLSALLLASSQSTTGIEYAKLINWLGKGDNNKNEIFKEFGKCAKYLLNNKDEIIKNGGKEKELKDLKERINECANAINHAYNSIYHSIWGKPVEKVPVVVI